MCLLQTTVKEILNCILWFFTYSLTKSGDAQHQKYDQNCSQLFPYFKNHILQFFQYLDSFFSVKKKKFLLWGGHNCLLFQYSFKTLICYSVYKESCKIIENLWSLATWLVPVYNITWHASPLPMYKLCYCTQTDSQTDIQKHSDWPLCAIEKPNEDPRELLTWSPHCTPCTLLDPARCICHPNAPPNPCTATILFKRQPNTRTFFFTKQAQHTHQRNFLQAAERWSSSSHGFDTPNTKWKNHTFGTLSPWGNSKT